MCGIAGYKTWREIDASVLQEMVAVLYHRGPDSAGFLHRNGYHAGMRRLSIVDLVTGDQPLYNEDQSVILIYNGEIYNYPQLKRELEQKGHRFRTTCDGEAICHLYEEYGEDVFEHLDGQFAAALWIEAEQKLILARDLPGEKPLYYARLSDTEVAFASEIKSLVKFPGLDLTLNYQALWDFPTFLSIPEPETVYQSIMALPRGHLLIADAQGVRVQAYANRFNLQPIDSAEDAIIAETRRVVSEAIYSRLLSDVPVGSFLSSGLDSSIVATLASQALPSLHTFSIGFEDLDDPYHGRADESLAAEQYAQQLGTKHHIIRVTGEDFRRELPVFCAHGDQPFAVSSGLGILAIAKEARQQGVKVLLSGDGADECFGGYSWYFHLKARNDEKTAGANVGREISFQNIGVELKTRLQILNSYPPTKRAWAWHYYAAETEKAGLYNLDCFQSAQSSLRFFEAYKSNGNWSPEDFIKQDREFYFPNEMLRKVDRMTMAYSVEGRVPFAAPSVLNHADKLHYSDLVRGDSLKWVLRRAFADVLPEDILSRPKHGFNVPIDHWLKNDWSDLVEETFSTESSLMRHDLITKKSREAVTRMLGDASRLNGHTIFSYIMLNMWLDNAYDRNHR